MFVLVVLLLFIHTAGHAATVPDAPPLFTVYFANKTDVPLAFSGVVASFVKRWGLAQNKQTTIDNFILPPGPLVEGKFDFVPNKITWTRSGGSAPESKATDEPCRGKNNIFICAFRTAGGLIVVTVQHDIDIAAYVAARMSCDSVPDASLVAGAGAEGGSAAARRSPTPTAADVDHAVEAAAGEGEEAFVDLAEGDEEGEGGFIMVNPVGTT